MNNSKSNKLTIRANPSETYDTPAFGYCGVCMTRTQTLDSHLQCLSSHTKPKYPVLPCYAKDCKSRFYKQSERQQHFVTAHPESKPMLKCGHCDFCCETTEEMSVHHQSEHTVIEIDLICDVCNKNFDSPFDLYMHFSQQHGTLRATFPDNYEGQLMNSLKDMIQCKTLTTPPGSSLGIITNALNQIVQRLSNVEHACSYLVTTKNPSTAAAIGLETQMKDSINPPIKINVHNDKKKKSKMMTYLRQQVLKVPIDKEVALKGKKKRKTTSSEKEEEKKKPKIRKKALITSFFKKPKQQEKKKKSVASKEKLGGKEKRKSRALCIGCGKGWQKSGWGSGHKKQQGFCPNCSPVIVDVSSAAQKQSNEKNILKALLQS